MKGSNFVMAAFGLAFMALYGYVREVRGYVNGVTVTAKAYEEHKSEPEEES